MGSGPECRTLCTAPSHPEPHTPRTQCPESEQSQNRALDYSFSAYEQQYQGFHGLFMVSGGSKEGAWILYTCF